MVLIPSYITLLIAHTLQSVFNVAITTLSFILIQGHKEGPIPIILVSPAALGLSTLVAAILLAAANIWDFLHPWITHCIDRGIVLLNVAIDVVNRLPYSER